MIYQVTGYRYEQEKIDISWDLARVLMNLSVCDSYWWFNFRDNSAEAFRCRKPWGGSHGVCDARIPSLEPAEDK